MYCGIVIDGPCIGDFWEKDVPQWNVPNEQELSITFDPTPVEMSMGISYTRYQWFRGILGDVNMNFWTCNPSTPVCITLLNNFMRLANGRTPT